MTFLKNDDFPHCSEFSTLFFSLKKLKIYGCNGKLKISAIFCAKKKRTKLRTMRNMITFQESHATKNDGIFSLNFRKSSIFWMKKKRTKLRTMRKIIIFQESHVCFDTKYAANLKRTNMSPFVRLYSERSHYLSTTQTAGSIPWKTREEGSGLPVKA